MYVSSRSPNVWGGRSHAIETSLYDTHTLFLSVIFHFCAPSIPIVLQYTNMSTYSANFRYVACKLLKLEAPENRKRNKGCVFWHLPRLHHRALQTQFVCKPLVFFEECSGVATYSLFKF